MPRKFHLKEKFGASKRFKQRKIRADILTVQVEVGEGLFATYPSLVFEGKSYEETPHSLEFMPDYSYGYPPPGAVKVSAVMTETVFGVLDNFQSGADTEGEVAWMTIIDGTAYWEDTGEPVETMEQFRAFLAEQAAQDAPPADENLTG